jgi:hypothetical protein
VAGSFISVASSTDGGTRVCASVSASIADSSSRLGDLDRWLSKNAFSSITAAAAVDGGFSASVRTKKHTSVTISAENATAVASATTNYISTSPPEVLKRHIPSCLLMYLDL